MTSSACAGARGAPWRTARPRPTGGRRLPPGLDRRRTARRSPAGRRQGAPPGAGPAVRPGRGRTARAGACPGAVAVELVHNFSLLHDDLMDGDTERRHRPTVWTVFGVGRARSWPATRCSRWPRRCCWRAPRRQPGRRPRGCSPHHQRLIARPGARTSRSSTATTSRSTSAWRWPRGKTGGAARLRVQHRRDARRRADRSWSWRLRRIRRARSGWPSSWSTTCWASGATPASTGKPVPSDLRARKKSLPVVAALASGTAAADQPARLLAEPGPARRRGRPAADRRARRGGRRPGTGRAPRRTAAGRRGPVPVSDSLSMPADVRATSSPGSRDVRHRAAELTP